MIRAALPPPALTLNFRIITHVGGSISASGAGGQANEPLVLQPHPQYQDLFGQLQCLDISPEVLRRLGSMLFDALLPGNIRRVYEQTDASASLRCPGST